MEPIIIYHANCWDGFCAAWLMRKLVTDAELFPAHYATDPPDCAGREVFIVDFSYKRPVMEKILTEASRVTVLDHHKTAEAELAGLQEQFPGSDIRFSSTQSGSTMAFDYISGRMRIAHAHYGSWWTLARYTEDRDLWRHELPESQEFNAGLRSFPLDCETWDGISRSLESLGPGVLIQDGKAILRYQKTVIDGHVKHAVMGSIAGWNVPMVNATTLFSEIAGEIAKGRSFGACYFDRHDGKRQFSLRSTPEGIDVSEVAKLFGGGGHKHAAGFELSGDLSHLIVARP